LKKIHEAIFSINPPLNALPGVTKPDECAMATAGVPMGSINARPDGTVTANVVIIGLIEKSIAIPMVIGIKSATTAVLLMVSVKKIAKRDITIIKTNGDWGLYAHDADVKAWGVGDEALLARWSLINSGLPMRIYPGQRLSMLLNDDFS